MTVDKNWYYAEGKQQKGPVTIANIEEFITSGVIKPDTLLWAGEGIWTPAKETIFADKFLNFVVPPPLPNANNTIDIVKAKLWLNEIRNDAGVDNKFVWLVVAVPLVGIFIELMVGEPLFWIYWILNIVLCVLDEKYLKSLGKEPPSTAWAFFIPVYLWKRAEILSQKKYYFWGWLVTFLISIALAFGADKKALEKVACETVTDIVHNQLYQTSSCESVSIEKEISDNFYKATAILDNGNEINITIKERKNGDIYVQIKD